MFQSEIGSWVKIVQKLSDSFGRDAKWSNGDAVTGIDYSKGTSHHVEGSHYVKCTDEEFARWCK